MAADEKRRTEEDVPVDRGVARSRETGGVENPEQPDQASTTGTTPSDLFVGRVAGEDVGYAGETGAEARSVAARRGRRAAPDDRGGRAGGMVSEIFGARSDDEAVGYLDEGPSAAGIAEVVPAGELTSLELDALQSTLTGAPFRDVLESAEGGLVLARTETGPWVSRLRPTLTHALAGLGDTAIPGVAARWAEHEELEDADADALDALLRPLVVLARLAVERGHRLYIWNRL
jgi:hypothetical protein